MKEVKINTDYITLVQLLKFLNITSSGGESRYFIENHEIFYNGVLESRKRKKLYVNDIIEIAGIGKFKITC